MTKIATFFAALLGVVGVAAAGPVPLTPAQLDSVSAGATSVAIARSSSVNGVTNVFTSTSGGGSAFARACANGVCKISVSP